MNRGSLTGRQQLAAFVVCAVLVGGLLAPIVYSEIKDMVKPCDWSLIPLFGLGLIVAIPLAMFFQNIIALLAGVVIVGIVRLLAALLPKRFLPLPVRVELSRGTTFLMFAAAIGILSSLLLLVLSGLR